MNWTTIIEYAGAFITIVSICLNIIQYVRKVDDRKSLRSQMQMQYNFHFLAARACTRIRHILDESSISCEDALSRAINEASVIRGIVDTARNSIIAYSREHLDFVPFYEHPAYPGKEAPEAVKLGKPPEELLRHEQNGTIEGFEQKSG